MKKLMISVLKAVAMRGPVARLSAWNQRAWRAEMHEALDCGTVQLSDVVPWGLMRPVSADGGNST